MFTKAEMTDLQVLNYYTSQQLARESIEDAIFKLKSRNRRVEGLGEAEENYEKILDLKAEKAILDAKLAAFDANWDAITPPSNELLDALRGLIAEVEELNANHHIFDDVVRLTTNSLNTFGAIHPGRFAAMDYEGASDGKAETSHDAMRIQEAASWRTESYASSAHGK